MNDITALIALAKEDFGMKRVNKAVDSLIAAVELLAAAQAGEAAPAAPAAPVALTEPAPAPKTVETTPADLARVLATQERAETEEPAKPAPRKRATNGTRSSDV